MRFQPRGKSKNRDKIEKIPEIAAPDLIGVHAEWGPRARWGTRARWEARARWVARANILTGLTQSPEKENNKQQAKAA